MNCTLFLVPININRYCTHTHTHARMLTGEDGRASLRRLVSGWMSDAGDSCTRHGFYEYITFYVHPNTNLSPSENQTQQTFTHRFPGKNGNFQKLLRVRQISTAKITANLSDGW